MTEPLEVFRASDYPDDYRAQAHARLVVLQQTYPLAECREDPNTQAVEIYAQPERS